MLGALPERALRLTGTLQVSRRERLLPAIGIIILLAQLGALQTFALLEIGPVCCLVIVESDVGASCSHLGSSSCVEVELELADCLLLLSKSASLVLRHVLSRVQRRFDIFFPTRFLASLLKPRTLGLVEQLLWDQGLTSGLLRILRWMGC